MTTRMLSSIALLIISLTSSISSLIISGFSTTMHGDVDLRYVAEGLCLLTTLTYLAFFQHQRKYHGLSKGNSSCNKIPIPALCEGERQVQFASMPPQQRRTINVREYHNLLVDLERKGVAIHHNARNDFKEGCGCVLQACATIDDDANAADWFERLLVTRVLHPKACYSKVIHACAKAGNLHRAEKWLLGMSQAGLDANDICYNSLINVCAQTGNVAKAEQWLEKMISVGLEPCGITYNSVLHACAKEGCLLKAEQWFGRMMNAGLKPSIHSFTIMIHACVQAEKLAKAEEWMDRMRRVAGIQPNAVAYGTLLEAYSRAGAYDRAEKVMESMKASGLEPSASCYRRMVKTYSKVLDLEKAEAWFSAMVEAGRPQATDDFNAIINACARSGKPQRAKKHFDDMMEQGVRPDSRTFTFMMNAYGNVGDGENAHLLLRHMRELAVPRSSNAYTALARAVAKQGGWQSVERVYEMSCSDGFPMTTYMLDILLNAYTAARQPERAEAVFRDAVKKNVRLDDVVLKSFQRAVGARVSHETLVDLGLKARFQAPSSALR